MPRLSVVPTVTVLLGLLALASAATTFGQQATTGQPVVTQPGPSSSAGGNASSTIASTGVFQQIWAAARRNGCTVQNNGSHVMDVTEGLSVAASLVTLAVVLQPGQTYLCAADGSVLVGQVNITGTAGDAFYAAQY